MDKKRISYSNLFAKECLVSALIALTREKPLSSVNISELCDKAGVSRMTFYRNYQSKEDIFLIHLTEKFEEYKEEDSRNNNSNGLFCDYAHISHYVNYILKHRDFLDALNKCGFDVIFLNKLNDYIQEKWKDRASKYVLAAFTGSIYNLFRMWSKNGYQEDKDILIESLLSLYSSSPEVSLPGAPGSAGTVG